MRDESESGDDIKLYTLLVDQVQRYNSIFWQAPAALLAANVISLGALAAKPAFLLGLTVFNAVFIFAFHKLVFTQRFLIKATKSAENRLRDRFPDFIPTFEDHPLPIRAPGMLVGMLAFLNFCLLAYALIVLRGVAVTALTLNLRWLSILGLVLGFLGALLILLHSFKTTGATTPADQAFLMSAWWYRIGLGCLALGFFLQLLALLL